MIALDEYQVQRRKDDESIPWYMQIGNQSIIEVKSLTCGTIVSQVTCRYVNNFRRVGDRYIIGQGIWEDANTTILFKIHNQNELYVEKEWPAKWDTITHGILGLSDRDKQHYFVYHLETRRKFHAHKRLLGCAGNHIVIFHDLFKQKLRRKNNNNMNSIDYYDGDKAHELKLNYYSCQVYKSDTIKKSLKLVDCLLLTQTLIKRRQCFKVAMFTFVDRYFIICTSTFSKINFDINLDNGNDINDNTRHNSNKIITNNGQHLTDEAIKLTIVDGLNDLKLIDQYLFFGYAIDKAGIDDQGFFIEDGSILGSRTRLNLFKILSARKSYHIDRHFKTCGFNQEIVTHNKEDIIQLKVRILELLPMFPGVLVDLIIGYCFIHVCL